MHTNQIVTYCIRGTQAVFAIIVLGVAAGFLGEVGTNVDRVTFALVTSILNILYFGYIFGILPYVTQNGAPSVVILSCEIIMTIFYLAAMGAVADITPSGSCSFRFWGSGDTACSLLKTLIPFTLFNWLLFTASLILFILYSFVPEIKSYGGSHVAKNTTYEYGAIYSDYNQQVLKPIGGLSKEAEGIPPAEGDDEANVGVHSVEEHAESHKYPEGTDESDHHPNDEGTQQPRP